MIQLSPQIQSTEHLTENPEASKTDKKDGHGVFARLLAGLLQKSNKTGAESALSGGQTSVPLGGTDEKAALSGRNRDTGEALSGPAASRSGRKSKVSLLKGGDAADGLVKAEKPDKKEKGLSDARSLTGGEEALMAISGPETAEQAARARPAAGDGAEGEAAGPAREIPPAGVSAGGEIAEALPASPALPETAAPAASAAVPLAETDGTDRGRFVRDREQGLNAGERSDDAPETLPALAAVSKGRAVPERDGRTGGAAEVRGRDRRKERFNAETGEVRAGPGRQDGPATESVRTTAAEEASSDRGRETELTVELRSMGKTQSEISMEREDRPVQGFQNMLARELHENLNGDIVRHASVMLREGGEGTIRLSLRPESLGSVKIRLEIAENKIAGRIIVESDEAFKAFEQELHSLEQSFRESGFDGANLEMAFSSDSGREGRSGQGGEAESLFAGRLSASRYDAAVPGLSEEPEAGLWLGMRLDNQGRPQINMLV